MVINTNSKPFPVITIGSTDRDVIEELAQRTGVGTVSLRAGRPTHRDLYMWRCFSLSAVTFLQQIRKYLIAKRPIVDFILKTIDQMERRPVRGYSRSFRMAVMERTKELNERGPAGAAIRSIARSKLTELPYVKLLRQSVYLPQSILYDEQVYGHASPDFENTLPNKGMRLCPVCRSPFPIRSNPTAKNPGATCSVACTRVFRKRRGTSCRVIDRQLLAVLAGHIDAEANVRVARSGRTIHARVHYGNTCRLVVEMMKRIRILAASRNESLRIPLTRDHGIGAYVPMVPRGLSNRFILT
jgi:hypothetical protein